MSKPLKKQKYIGSWGNEDPKYLELIKKSIKCKKKDKALAYWCNRGDALEALSPIFNEVYGYEENADNLSVTMELLDSKRCDNVVCMINPDSFTDMTFDFIYFGRSLVAPPIPFYQNLNDNGELIFSLRDEKPWPDVPQKLIKIKRDGFSFISEEISEVFVFPGYL